MNTNQANMNHNLNHNHNPHQMNSNNTNNNDSFIIVNNNNPPSQSQPKPNPMTEQKYDPSTEAEQIANGGHNELKHDDDDCKKVITCKKFEPHKVKQPGLRANVFVSKDCTRDLSEHIVEENWGMNMNVIKYLDYIFYVKHLTQVKNWLSTREEIVVFHTD